MASKTNWVIWVHGLTKIPFSDVPHLNKVDILQLVSEKIRPY